ncbi:aryl-sulfate sulfotransferase [Winogradskyella forsetii]|uniref:aryl-sulfate sulfotransferase n=1 Tax=Winogradskyella forsetii TaxID=2686077 RepID=UPI0015BA59B8|nr:aryl-sulfate sulfotransferase [Winogradskyella forsetii]
MKYKIFSCLLLLLISYTNHSSAQETIGLLYTDQNQLEEGYTLFSPRSNSSVYLIDNCGNKVKEWDFNGRPTSVPYLLENGTLLRSGTQGIELKDWDNLLLWSYDINASLGYRQHHDIEPMPNGNILAIVRDFISEEELISLGKDPSLIAGRLKSEKIMEFQPIGTNEIQVVWEWHFADRFIQDFDVNKSNYGIVEDHPELIDINYEDYNMVHEDFIHMNGIDYNADLDQIIMSCKSLGEIYIIDHSTTTAEAATSSGGNYNKGGDFLWRWGNPEVYRQGTDIDRKLFEQHDPKWIPESYANSGKITVFNNDVGATQTHSSINILAPTPIATGYELTNNKFRPLDIFFSWDGEILNETVYEPKMSGVTALPNGNLVICESSKGRISEINNSGDILWVYRNPSGENIINQYTTEENIYFNNLFRAEKYPADYIGFSGKNLIPGSVIEDVNSNSVLCNQILSTDDAMHSEIKILTNPVENETIVFSSDLINSTLIDIYNLNGKLIVHNVRPTDNKIQLPYRIDKGLYFLYIKDDSNNKSQVIKFLKN